MIWNEGDREERGEGEREEEEKRWEENDEKLQIRLNSLRAKWVSGRPGLMSVIHQCIPAPRTAPGHDMLKKHSQSGWDGLRQGGMGTRGILVK